MPKKLKSIFIDNEQGQMAIFVALMFQVLFVLFAMLVNIGLIIHDKINLQNSVDLAAYYGAQKQAEVLNAIAHINYQIRQANKLLAWRYRVLGDLGKTNHPIYNTGKTEQDVGAGFGNPSVCVDHDRWEHVRKDQNICKDVNNTIPAFQEVRVVADFIGYNFLISNIVKGNKDRFTISCKESGPMNWRMALAIYYNYRTDIALRKEMLMGLAGAISASPSDFTEIDGNPASQGIVKTFTKNLTESNRESFEANPQFQFINSLGLAPCNVREDNSFGWLKEILIAQTLYYSDFSNDQGACRGSIKTLLNEPRHLNDTNVYPLKEFQDLKAASMPVAAREFAHDSLGYEKNPWCVAYIGVTAQTAPRKPFAPFGSPVVLRARSFAKPFGGRIGPWYQDSWANAPGATSSGARLVDANVPLRTLPSTTKVTLGSDDTLPNYSRYPGDPLGLKSNFALSALAQIPQIKQTGSLKVEEVIETGNRIKQLGDTLTWRKNLPSTLAEEAWLRQAEKVAIAPDLFDITYYSIEPKYYQNYLSKIKPDAFSNSNIGQLMLSDHGAHRDNDPPGSMMYSVGDQIAKANDRAFINSDIPYWVVKSPDHLLTSWTQEASNSFNFPVDRFGKCLLRPSVDLPAGPPTPGDCAVGGRTGYSVELVSRSFLLYDQHRLGGASDATGPILNPPPANF